MFGDGMQEILIIAVVVIILIVGGLTRRGGRGIRISGPTLVLRRFKIDEDPSATILVDIIGRPKGIIAWLLTIMGIDAETSLKVTGKELTFRSSSLFGQIHHVAPLPSISSTHCGYSKPIGYFIIGIIFILVGLLSAISPILWEFGLYGSRGLTFGLIVGAIFLIAYWLSKKMTMVFETSGGMTMGLIFKRSVIENVPVDIEKTLKAIHIVNNKIIESQVR